MKANVLQRHYINLITSKSLSSPVNDITLFNVNKKKELN